MSVAPLHRTRRNKEDSARYKFSLTQTRGFLPLWLALIILILQETIISTNRVEAARELDRVQVKGWTEVNRKWPLEQGEFYVALEKGHHFIEVKLPKKLHNDLDVRLEYYYDYQKVRPVFQMVPCSTNVDIIKNDEPDSQRASLIDLERYTRPSSQPAATWLTHEMRVQKSDCERRNELAYNVLLHDANDVFAWRVMEIKSVPSETITTTTETPLDFPHSLVLDPAQTTQTSQVTETTTQVPETTAAPTTRSPESSPLVSPEDDPFDESIDDVGKQFTKKPGEVVHYEPTTVAPQPSDNEVEVETTTDGPQWPRLKRFAVLKEERDGADETTVSLICRPSSCDRSLFHHPRFMPLVHGVPKLPRDNLLDKKYRYFLNTKNNELEFSQETSEDLADVNLCVDLELYMDPGTEIEFQIEDSSSQTKTKLLELIQRKEEDISGGGTSLAAATNGKWERFKRCASDYMPKLKPVDPAGHSIKLKFVPRVPAVADKQVAVLADSERSISLNRLYLAKDYLPNAVTLPAAEAVDSYWVLDKDGKRRPKLKLESRIPDESTSSDSGPKRTLQISNIDPKQESFDITSRWLKVTDLETLENPIHFYYKADRADWVKGIEFQFQKANYGSNVWNTRELYVEFNPIEQDLNIKFTADLSKKPNETLTNPKNLNHRYGELSPTTTTTTTSTITTMSTTTTSTTTTTTSTVAPITADAIITTTTVAPIGADDTTTAVVPTTTTTGAPVTPLVGQISIPVELKGLDAEEFRIRVRHHIKEEAQRASSYLKLNVLQLAFADACAEPNFCLNGGSCKPTGTATAKCTCLPGYSGEHCEKVKPCEVLYGGQTGGQLCESVGAKCQQNLPVLRCVWPNDQYYECRALFDTANNNGDLTQVVPTMSTTEYEERLNDQTRTIIILSVFISALLLFSVVIVGNMVGRLLESRKRLRRAEHDAHELALRSHPGSSGAARLQGRQKPATVSYNNQAFDTE